MNRHDVVVVDSDDGAHIGLKMIQLFEHETYVFPDGRRFTVRWVSSFGIDDEIYQGDAYWIKVKINNVELF